MTGYMFSGMRRIMNTDLQDPFVYDLYKKDGYCWIRRHYPRFDTILRNPTIGYPVEIFTRYEPGCVKLDSRSARKIIHKICYC
jgi:hypothetical protein